MRFKAGVVTFRLGPRLERAMEIADSVFRSELGFDATVTSCREGQSLAQFPPLLPLGRSRSVASGPRGKPGRV